MGSGLLLGIVLGWPALTTALGLMREKVLGRLYWHLRMLLDDGGNEGNDGQSNPDRAD